MKKLAVALGFAVVLSAGLFSNSSAEENTQELLHVQNPFMDVLGNDSYIGVILKDKRQGVYLPKCSDGRIINGEFDSPEKAFNAILSKCI